MSITQKVVQAVEPRARVVKAEPVSRMPHSADEPYLHESIALLAYQRAQDRNFEPGHELDDWLDAEAEILAQAKALKGLPA